MSAIQTILIALCIMILIATQVLSYWLGTLPYGKGAVIWFFIVANAIMAGIAMFGICVLLPDSPEGFVELIGQGAL